jgi:hypothetical protein
MRGASAGDAEGEGVAIGNFEPIHCLMPHEKP